MEKNKTDYIELDGYRWFRSGDIGKIDKSIFLNMNILYCIENNTSELHRKKSPESGLTKSHDFGTP